MNRTELVKKSAKLSGVTEGDACSVLSAASSIIKETLGKGEEVKIHGFGQFRVSRRAPRQARDIRRNMDLVAPAHNVVTFKASRPMKDAANSAVRSE